MPIKTKTDSPELEVKYVPLVEDETPVEFTEDDCFGLKKCESCGACISDPRLIRCDDCQAVVDALELPWN